MTRYYSATAQDTTLTSSMTSSSTTMVVAATTGYPSGANYPFVLAVDYNTGAEELVLVTGASGLTLTITRAYNGTTAQAHAVGAVVRHVITAQDMTDAQTHYGTALTAGAHGVTGSLATFLGTSSSANLAALITDETGSGSLVFGTSPTIAIGINAQTGTTYTPILADAAKLVTLNNSSAITLTVPAGVFSAGQQINIQQIGVGQVTVQNDGTSTVTGTGTKLRAQYSAATIVCTASNTFTLIGDLA
jgi:hypothetical protein